MPRHVEYLNEARDGSARLEPTSKPVLVAFAVSLVVWVCLTTSAGVARAGLVTLDLSGT